MWLIPMFIVATFAVGAIKLRFVPPPGASTVVHFRRGSIRISRGSLRPHAREDVREMLSGAGVTRAFIAIMPNQRVVFSRKIPAAMHQRLRNVLLNQWA